MEKYMANGQNKNIQEKYEIRIQEHLDDRWAEWFYGMSITYERDGSTTLRGPLPDQTVLHSVLDRIRDMNLQLISVNRVKSNGKKLTVKTKE
jgi:hypothetical protein